MGERSLTAKCLRNRNLDPGVESWAQLFWVTTKGDGAIDAGRKASWKIASERCNACKQV